MSMEQGGNAPAWLFSFVDLAFLLLIAMTQLAADARDPMPDLAEMAVPRIAVESTTPLGSAASTRWQLRIHAPDELRERPYELIQAPGEAGEVERIDAGALRARLVALRDREPRKPLLAPHEDARTQDLLDAVALVEEFWPGRRRTAVSPLRIGG
jgi:hypothetical protein